MSILEERLKEAMNQVGVNQSELATRSGCSKAAISQYLSGKNEPKHTTIVKFAEILGVDESWLAGNSDVSIVLTKKKIRPADVAEILGIGVEAVRIGLQNGNFSFGGAIKTSPKRHTYFIYPKLFDKYIVKQ